MPDWTRGMTRTYEFWEVNPSTWGDTSLIDTVTGCTIVRDSDEDTLGHATFEMSAWSDEDGVWDSERVIRVYLVTIQEGVRERFPLGTYMVQAPSLDFDGMRGSVTADGYTPLKELAGDFPPDYFHVDSGDAVAHAVRLMSTYAKMPVGAAGIEAALEEPYVSEEGEDWLSYCRGLLAKGKAVIELTGRGEAVITPDQDPRSLMPVRTFDDSNSSILMPEASVASDAVDVPNVVRVVYSTGEGCLVSEVVNDSKSSPTSTVNAGRRKVLRESSPELPDNPTQRDVDEYAKRLMHEKGSTSYELTFSHGFVPDVDLRRAVRLNYSAMGVNAVAQVVSMTIECTPACKVTTVARYTKQEVVR